MTELVPASSPPYSLPKKESHESELQTEKHLHELKKPSQMIQKSSNFTSSDSIVDNSSPRVLQPEDPPKGPEFVSDEDQSPLDDSSSSITSSLRRHSQVSQNRVKLPRYFAVRTTELLVFQKSMKVFLSCLTESDELLNFGEIAYLYTEQIYNNMRKPESVYEKLFQKQHHEQSFEQSISLNWKILITSTLYISLSETQDGWNKLWLQEVEKVYSAYNILVTISQGSGELVYFVYRNGLEGLRYFKPERQVRRLKSILKNQDSKSQLPVQAPLLALSDGSDQQDETDSEYEEMTPEACTRIHSTIDCGNLASSDTNEVPKPQKKFSQEENAIHPDVTVSKEPSQRVMPSAAYGSYY
jgi:hypothetical protein